MTGCPNGCARPYNADIGLVGRSATRDADGTPGPGTYTIFLGGRTLGDRLNSPFKDYVPFDRVVAELVPVFARFKAERFADETFGDFCHRIGVEELRLGLADRLALKPSRMGSEGDLPRPVADSAFLTGRCIDWMLGHGIEDERHRLFVLILVREQGGIGFEVGPGHE